LTQYSFASGNVDELENAVHENTKIIYIETPSNTLLVITDIEAVVRWQNQKKWEKNDNGHPA
jgi:cystathionine beta-lyase/cystathionine gamma-synthase